MINSSDISVVVQGPICFEKDVCLTSKVCDSIRKYLPNAEIILSTWEGEKFDLVDHDKLVINKPIKSQMMYIIWTNNLRLYSVNHQIITTLNGIKQASRKYVLKLRSDLSLSGTEFINFFERYQSVPENEEYKSWKIFNRRIVTLPTFDANKKYGLCFNVCDWFFFGTKGDVYDYFNIPLVDFDSLYIKEGDDYPRGEYNLPAEQYLCVTFIKKHIDINMTRGDEKNNKLIEDFEIFLANNIIPVAANKANLLSLKYDGCSYATPTYKSDFYFFNKWIKLYNKYGGGNEKKKIETIFDYFLHFLFICKRAAKNIFKGKKS